MSITNLFEMLSGLVWGWPLIGFIAVVGTIVTLRLNFVQIRYFLASWKYVLCPKKKTGKAVVSDITPMQAFFNSLSVCIGNSALAGMACVIYLGGPGSIFWVSIFGFICMSLRFAEVFLGTEFMTAGKDGLGGPIAYLQKVPGGRFLPYIFAAFTLGYTLTFGNAIQCNSIGLGLSRILHIPALPIAVGLFLFVIYVMMGGAKRILQVSDALIPVKVIVFFVASVIILTYHWSGILPAIKLIISQAFTPNAIAGGGMVVSMQLAIRTGLSRSMGAAEAGLGTAALFFGATGEKEPSKNGIMSMLGAFVSIQLVCIVVALCIIASGVWNSGLTSIDLTIAAYETVFGSFGPWLVTFLSITFGMGVLIGIAFVSRMCWMFLTGGRCVWGFNLLYCTAAFFGAISSVSFIWYLGDLFCGGMLAINVFGILILLPTIVKGLKKFEAKNKAA